MLIEKDAILFCVWVWIFMGSYEGSSINEDVHGQLSSGCGENVLRLVIDSPCLRAGRANWYRPTFCISGTQGHTSFHSQD